MTERARTVSYTHLKDDDGEDGLQALDDEPEGDLCHRIHHSEEDQRKMCIRDRYYMDLDLYRYFIGRADQSVNESIMVKRVDQQLRVTRHMIDCQDLDALKGEKKLRAYICLLYTSCFSLFNAIVVRV